VPDDGRLEHLFGRLRLDARTYRNRGQRERADTGKPYALSHATCPQLGQHRLGVSHLSSTASRTTSTACRSAASSAATSGLSVVFTNWSTAELNREIA